MRLTERQRETLDKIAAAPAADEVRVVGWLLGGPVVRHPSGRLSRVTPEGRLEGAGRDGR